MDIFVFILFVVILAAVFTFTYRFFKTYRQRKETERLWTTPEDFRKFIKMELSPEQERVLEYYLFLEDDPTIGIQNVGDTYEIYDTCFEPNKLLCKVISTNSGHGGFIWSLTAYSISDYYSANYLWFTPYGSHTIKNKFIPRLDWAAERYHKEKSQKRLDELDSMIAAAKNNKCKEN